eukprot:5643065-Prymnesium_polylepis.1
MSPHGTPPSSASWSSTPTLTAPSPSACLTTGSGGGRVSLLAAEACFTTGSGGVLYYWQRGPEACFTTGSSGGVLDGLTTGTTYIIERNSGTGTGYGFSKAKGNGPYGPKH